MVIFSKPKWLRHAVGSSNGPLSAHRGLGTTGERPGSTQALGAESRPNGSGDGASVPIFSLDIQPGAHDAPLDQVRLATCGQDGRIYLWRLGALWEDAKRQCTRFLGAQRALPSAAAEKENGKQADDLDSALLGVLSPAHQGAANVVRWHPAGTLLASGGDDGTVMLFSRGPATADPFGRGTLLNVPFGLQSKENWTACSILRTHDSDVLDISFAPHGEALASCSVDNSICVWRIELSTKRAGQEQWVTANGSLVARLRGHEGMVKGIAWDPTNQFIASQSDDRSVILWRTDHWGEIEKRLRKEFEAATTEANLRAWFMRLAWSPSGAELVTTNGYRNKCHVAPLYRRAQDFADPIEFVGHRAPVVSVRWSPCVYTRSPNGPFEGKNRLYFCVALGSKDHGLTIWRADHGKPFVSLVDLFDGDVLDLSWNAAGNVLVACSTDGSVFFAQFEPEELGYTVPETIAKEAIRKEMALFMGGVSTLASKTPTGLGDANHGLLDPSVLAMQQRQDSERRMASATEQCDNSTHAGSATTSASPAEPACAPQTHPFDLVTVNGAVPTPSDQVRFENQREERLKDGKRRIIPVALGGSSLPVAQPSSVPRDDDGHPNLAWKRTGHHGTTAVERIKKRHRTHSLNAALSGGILRNTAATPAKLAPDGRAQGLPENEAARPNRLSAGGAPPQSSKVTCLDIMEESSGPDLPLDATAAEKRQVWVLPDAEADFVVESVLQSMRCTLVFGVKSGEQLWKQAVRGMISALAGSGGEGLILIGTTDAALHVFSLRSGMRLLAPLMLDAPVVWMAWHDKVVFALTRSASFYVYDVGILTRWRHELHLRPALCGTARFLAALRALDTLWLPERFLWNSGRRILFLFLGNGDLYAYIAAQAQWIRLMDDAFMASPYHRLGTNSDENTSTDVGTDLATLDKTRALMGHTDNNAEEAVDLLELADPQREISDTTAHLELLWLAASSLQNETEKRFWLHKLVKWLVQHGDEARLSELCDRLLDVGASNTVAIDETKEDSSIWRQSHLAMFDQIVLPTLAMNPELENMLNTYRELFKMLDAHQKEAGMSSTDESLRKP